ncbi:uncharacterized protein CIMG_05340 [Coccidioides immitis RS]|uniref:Uncharacterized protein n=1 Tax=Coccidioides immitis (strain RS) TaxID=246410 RepID=J3KFC7_COCIM|nr:uncharacterized protein CIMG_05340 [Coccidioides immitis RS]EAS34316.3 hypothetical protein CIMG_05340 [Coccidioides immitis RS]
MPVDHMSCDEAQKMRVCLLYVQLWLCAMRQFVVLFQDHQATAVNVYDLNCVRGPHRLAGVAQRLSYDSAEIRQLCCRETNETTARCDVEMCAPEQGLEHIFPNGQAGSTPALNHNGEDDVRRYNRPRASQLQNDGAYFFVGHVYGCDQPAAQRLTLFAVTREPINSPLTLVQRGTYSPSNPGLDDMEDITPPLAPGFEDFSAPLAQKTDISLHRSAIEILQMWYESSRTSLIVLFLFSSRSYYKFIRENVLQLRSTINLLAKDHYFMTSRKISGPGDGTSVKKRPTTVYAAELLGILMGLNLILTSSSRSKAAIFTDNQAALIALQNPRRSSGQSILLRIIDSLERANSQGLKEFYWIPAHHRIC